MELENILRKYSQDELSAKAIIKTLEGIKNCFENYDQLTSNDVEALIKFQDSDGGFKTTHCIILDSEIAQDIYYLPSYYITLTLVKLSNEDKYKIPKKVLKKALDFCCSNKFLGHGYESGETQVRIANLFVENGIKEYIKKNQLETCKMNIFLKGLARDYEMLIAEGRTFGTWGGNYKADMEKFVSLMEED